MRHILFRAVSVACAIAFSTSSHAYCSAPSKPYCASSYSEFSSSEDFNRCRREVEAFANDTDEYVRCRQQEAKRDIDRAIDELDSVIESFNARAKR
jgi:hypothetical protein